MAKSKSTSFKKQTFSSSHLVITALVFGVVGGIIGWAISHAAPKLKDSGNGTISNPIMVTDLNGNGLPNRGDTITFKVATTQTNYPVVSLECFQGSVLVAQGRVSWWVNPANNIFTLASDAWPSGTAANCTAHLQDWDTYYKTGKYTNIASISFNVNP